MVNVEYADEAYRLREARLENIRLHGLLRMKETSTHRYLAAKVVGKNLTFLRDTLTLNVGASDSVRERMPVVNESGLVGLVVATTNSNAIVNILLNTDFRASVKIQRSRVDGILAWDGVDLLIKNIPVPKNKIPNKKATTLFVLDISIIIGFLIVTIAIASVYNGILQAGVVVYSID